jgi:hypothetical protein
MAPRPRKNGRNWHSVSPPPSPNRFTLPKKKSGQSKSMLSKILKIPDLDTLQSAYDTYAVSLINLSMVVPVNSLTEAIEAAREFPVPMCGKSPPICSTTVTSASFSKNSFLKELWGSELRQSFAARRKSPGTRNISASVLSHFTANAAPICSCVALRGDC